MRRLLAVAAGYCAALVLAHYVMPHRWLLPAAGAAAVLGLFCLLFRRHRAGLAALTVLLSAAAGFGWTLAHYELFIYPADALAGRTLTVRAMALDYTRVYDSGYVSNDLLLCQNGLPRVRVLVYDYADEPLLLEPGSFVSAELRLTSALERAGGSTDYYSSRGVYLRANMREERETAGRWDGSWIFFPRTLAKALREQALKLFPSDVAPLAQALITGEKSELNLDVRTSSAIKTAGLSHVIVVSGMHLAFFLGALRLLTGRRRAAAAVGAPVILLFMAVTGFTPSAVRAGIMQLLLLLAPLLRRENDPATSLSAAALLLLLINPQAIGSLSLQLSFSAMAGIMLVSPRVYAWLMRAEKIRKNRLLRGMAGTVSSTIGALLLTTPLTALYFGYVPLYSLLTNLLCMWAMSLGFVAGCVSCALGLVWTPLGTALAWLTAWPLRYVVLVVRIVARLPCAALYTRGNFAAWWLVFAYAVFALGYLTKGKRPFRPVLPLCACVITLAAVTLLQMPSRERGMTVTALDVGQGECVVVEQENSVVVIDCGGLNTAQNAGDTACAWLGSKGRGRIDLLVLTHLHADHANGVETLLSRMDVARLALPEDADDAGYTENIIALCAELGTELLYITQDTSLHLGGLDATLYAPLGSAGANERGLIFLGAYGNFDFLVTGDADTSTERILTKLYELPDIELLVAGHHGSRYSTGAELLDECRPDMAFISVGYNSYGHPSGEVLERLSQYGAQVYRTDLDGNISITVGKSDG